MQPSLEKGRLDGWAMWTRCNPSGVFIALEELGYLLTSVALACSLRSSCSASSLWSAPSSATRRRCGIDRGDLFEISVIASPRSASRSSTLAERVAVGDLSIVWSALIVTGPLVAVVLRRAAARSFLT